jgi:hypothetical protein
VWYRRATTPVTPATVLNAGALAGYTRRLAERVGALVESDEFVLLLGGDCSILFGPALALRRRGRYGPRTSTGRSTLTHRQHDVTSARPREGTAIITGRASLIADVDGLAPYVRDDDLVILGVRDYDPGGRRGTRDRGAVRPGRRSTGRRRLTRAPSGQGGGHKWVAGRAAHLLHSRLRAIDRGEGNASCVHVHPEGNPRLFKGHEAWCAP